MSAQRSSGLSAALLADGPAPDRAEKLDLYGQFVGNWDADIVTYSPDVRRIAGTARSTLDGFWKAARSRMSG